MRFRIGNYDSRYWIEGKRFLIWRRMPSIHDYIYESFPYSDNKTKYYEKYEDARTVCEEYIARYCNQSAVYAVVK